MATATYTRAESYEIATTIKRQIGVGSLMALGASNFMAVDGGLRFNARVLPFNKDGKRSARAASMLVEVRLNFLDLYDIRVVQVKGFDAVDHITAENVDAYSLAGWMLALDYDGAEVLNPRYL